MDQSNFRNPLETVQIISIFSYTNVLSDILFAENFLNETDQHKPIPIVNALHHYLLDNNDKSNLDLNERKLHLARKLINGTDTDLYGAKENEIPDIHFVNIMLNHIIKSLVFERFGNIYGFIADAVRSSSNESLNTLTYRLKESIRTLRFDNENGKISTLDDLSVDNIFENLIIPLFPVADDDTSIISVDFLYAQAGLMFLQSVSGLDAAVNQSVVGIKFKESKDAAEAGKFQEYVQVAHVIEQLVAAGQINKAALKIFALPALIYYVFTEKIYLQSEGIEDLVNKPHYWSKAFESLFSYLNQAFLATELLQDDYRYQFYLALSSFKNRTTLAREAIETNCPPLTDREMEHEIGRYKNNPQTYICKNGNKSETLNDLNAKFRHLINNITRRYYIYEKEICREAFGDDFIASMDNVNVVISKGLFHKFFYITIGFNVSQVEQIKSSDDFFEFYFPESEKYDYYALIRTGYNVSMIKVTELSNLRSKFVGKFGRLRNNIFATRMKREDEDFQKFVSRLAEERSSKFNATLELSGYEKTRKEWWKNFGLSLIPFYTCAKSINEGRKVKASISCSIDVILVIPVLGAAGSVAGKMASTVSKSLITISHTTFRTLALRTSLRSILKVTGILLAKEVAEFIALFELKTFQKLGISMTRLVDPGFELVFTIGKGGLRSIGSLIALIEKRNSVSFGSVKALLKSSEGAIAYVPKQVGSLSGKEVLINSLIGGEGYGFGYKYIRLASGQIAEMRTVPELMQELPVVLSRITKDNRKMYNRIDLDTGEMIGEEIFIDDRWMELSKPASFQLRIESAELEISCVDGNIVGKKIPNMKSKMEILTEAIDYAVKTEKLPKTKIENELKKYAFLETDKTEMNFVKEWMNNKDLKVPSWAEQYKIQEPDLFFQLKYNEMMENPAITLEEAAPKIQDLYRSSNIEKITDELPVAAVLKDFKLREAYNFVRFEDYYALRYYGGSGYQKMAGNSDETRRMKNAIYRLAIRQSEDPSEKFVKRLFRGEGRIPEAIEKELFPGREEYELQKFTSTSTDIMTSIKYSEFGSPAFTQVLYEMKFENPIVRTRVEHLFVKDEKETILLPGTKFHIDTVKKWSEVTESGFKQNYIKVEMTHMDQAMPKVERQKSIMKEIKMLMETDTVFYY